MRTETDACGFSSATAGQNEQGEKSGAEVDHNWMMAASLLMLVPVGAIVILGQRHPIEGLRMGGVKG